MQLRKTLTRRASKPFRVLSVFKPKSKSKSQDAGSQTSTPEIPSAESVPSTPPIATVVVVEAQIVEEPQTLDEKKEPEPRGDHEVQEDSEVDKLHEKQSVQEQSPKPSPAPPTDVVAEIPELHVDEAVTLTTEEAVVEAVEEAQSEVERSAIPIPETVIVELPPSAAQVAVEDVREVEEVDGGKPDVEEVAMSQESSDDKLSVTTERDESSVVAVGDIELTTNDDDDETARAHCGFPLTTTGDDDSARPPVTVVELFGDNVDSEPVDSEMAAERVENALEKSISASSSQSGPGEEEIRPADSAADVNPFLVDVDADEDSASARPYPRAANEAASSISGINTTSQDSTDASNSAPADTAPTDNGPQHSSTTLDINKDVPPSPPAPSDSESDEVPALHAPGLTLPTLFLPIPNTDPLTTLLIKHVPEPHLRPPRDISGDWQQSDFNTLVMTNNWRALARMARDRIMSASPSDVELILDLWYIRLSSLARLRLFNQAAAECDNFFVALSSIDPPSAQAYVLNNILPFELEVLQARCSYWSGDTIGYLDDLSLLHTRCKVKAKRAKNRTEVEMWKERGARMCLVIASHLIELKDFAAALNILEPLSSSASSPELLSAIARVYLQAGDVAAAARLISTVEAHPGAQKTLKLQNSALLAAAYDNWQDAAERFGQLAAEELNDVKVSLMSVNNQAVALLNQGKLREAIQTLETMLQLSPSAAATTEPYLFNLSTLYELRSALTAHKKRELLIEVAKWSGDGLRTACLKLPAA